MKKSLKSSVLSALFGCVLGTGLTIAYYSWMDRPDSSYQGGGGATATESSGEILDAVAEEGAELRMVFEEWYRKEGECTAETADYLLNFLNSPSSSNRGTASSLMSKHCRKFRDKLMPEIIEVAKTATTAGEILSMVLALNELKPDSSAPVHAFYQSLDESDSRYVLYKHAKANYDENLRISNNNPAMIPW